MHPVLDSELETFDGTSTGLPLTFFGLSLGAALSSVATLTQDLDADAHGAFIGLLVASGAMAVFFAITSVVRWRQRQNLIKNIRKRPPMTGPGS